MFHLQHAWKGCVSNVASKTTLAKIYGPLLVSFSERPVITDQDPTNYKTEEAAILEVILEVCDLQFWDNLSMLKMHLAFNSKEDNSEVQVVDSLEDNVNQISVEPSEYENEVWFSCLFGPNESPPKKALEAERKDIENPWGSSISVKCQFTPQCIESPEKIENQHDDSQLKERPVFAEGNKKQEKDMPFRKLSQDIEEYPRNHMFLSGNPRSAQEILKDIKKLLTTLNNKI
nr:hypothetical transcript [Hymenolepis microstoma]